MNPFDSLGRNEVYIEFLSGLGESLGDSADLVAIWKAAGRPEPDPVRWVRERVPPVDVWEPGEEVWTSPAIALEYAAALDPDIKKALDAAIFLLLRADPAGRMVKEPDPHKRLDLRLMAAETGARQGGLDLRLLSPYDAPRCLPAAGRDLIVVAGERVRPPATLDPGVVRPVRAEEQSLHFRIFDGDGRMVVDMPESRLSGRPRGLSCGLRIDLERLWPPHALSQSERRRVITAVHSIIGHVPHIPAVGQDLVVVAAIDGVLHFRIFDGDGKQVANTDEERFRLVDDTDGMVPDSASEVEYRRKKARALAGLKDQLAGLWPPHALSQRERRRVITAVTALFGYRPCEGYTRKTMRAGVAAWTRAAGALSSSWQIDDALLGPARAAFFGALERDPLGVVRRAPAACRRLAITFVHLVSGARDDGVRHVVREMVDHYGRERWIAAPEAIWGRARKHIKALFDDEAVAAEIRRYLAGGPWWLKPAPFADLLRDACEVEGLDWGDPHQAESICARIESAVEDVLALGY
jgi:hypothetical protein